MRVLSLIVLLSAASVHGAVVNVFQYQGFPQNLGNGQPQIPLAGATPIGTFAVPNLMFGPNFFPLGANNNFATDIFANINVAATGTYTFQTISDDGSVLFIDGQAVVNNNFYQGPTARSASITLTAGTHFLEVQYFQGGGGAELSVPLPAGVTYVDPGTEPYLNLYSLSGNAQTGYPVVKAADQFVCSIPTAVLNYGSQHSGSNWFPCGLTNNFAADMTGYFDVSADGLYTFSTSSDDGSYLVIDGAMVVNNGFFQGNTQRSGTIFLAAGKHVFDLQYFQGGGGAGLDLTVPAGVTMSPLPEPSTVAMIAMPLMVLAFVKRGSLARGLPLSLIERCHDAIDENSAFCRDRTDRSRSRPLFC
jgi:uncharacterized protein YaiE (UPF0345 family)